jgi:small subunit ribosomal protein S5
MKPMRKYQRNRNNRKPYDRKDAEKSKIDTIMETWIPKTEIGKKVKAGEIKNIDYILDAGIKILEPEIVDLLLPTLEQDLLAIGQSKGKFGGGKRSIWKQTQKKTKEGNKPTFATVALVGDRDGHVGIGYGKAKETVPAREKAIRKAKLSIMKIRRGCGAWACDCGESHSIPLKTKGKMSSVIVELIPAPKGTKLVIQGQLKKILELAGVKDVYSQTEGQTKTGLNLIKACMEALQNLNLVKINKDFEKRSGLTEGNKK